MNALTIGKVIDILQRYENQLGEDTLIRLSFLNDYDVPDFSIEKDEFGVKFVMIS